MDSNQQRMREEKLAPIRKLLTAAGTDGMSINELARALGEKKSSVQDRCHRYRVAGLLFISCATKAARYFISAEAMAPYLLKRGEIIAAQKAAAEVRAKERSKMRNDARPRKTPKPNGAASPWRQETPTRRNTTHQPKRPVEIINPGVEIQRIPCSNDYRFSVSPHFKGEFSREWQEKRA